MNVAARYHVAGTGGQAIAADLEAAIHGGRLSAHDRLPPIRQLAGDLGVSPGTVASAYRRLRERGLVTGEGRRGTVVLSRPALGQSLFVEVPPGVRDLADGSPDPTLLPPLEAAVAALDLRPRRYDDGGALPQLVEHARAAFAADGVPGGSVTVVGGARDGIERALAAWTRPGDRVALEDPCFTGVLDLVTAMGLVVVPVGLDAAGPLPSALAAALADGVAAVVVTPRAHNPTGAALDDERTVELQRVLDRHPHVLLVEDDHSGPLAGVAARTLVTPQRARWVVARSVSKALGPDLRVAVLAGDTTTIARIEDRQVLGTGWVSTLLQQLVLHLLTDEGTGDRLDSAAAAYAERRTSAVDALANEGILIDAPSGSNLWIPVAQEAAVLAGLLEAGWAVGAGERHRIATPPGIRVATTTLAPGDAGQFAADLAGVLRGHRPRPAS